MQLPVVPDRGPVVLVRGQQDLAGRADFLDAGPECRHDRLDLARVDAPFAQVAELGTRAQRVIAGARLAYVVVPKVTDVVEVARVTDHVNQAARAAGIARHIPIHVLIETHAALEQAFDIASLVQVECLSFGLMDFVSAHHGAIPGEAMRSPQQFEHPLVRRAMLEISAACHRHGKVPSHNVSTDVQAPQRAGDDARRARSEFGYLRKWSIHPGQIEPIVAAFRPGIEEIGAASQILLAAHENNWAPIRHDGQLHDRASYRYYWSLLQRAHATGTPLPDNVAELFFD